jgi:predicted nucleic acid-binding protein
MRYLLDTPVLLDHLRGDAVASSLLDRLVDAEDELMTCAVVAAEVTAAVPESAREVAAALLEALGDVPIDRTTGHAAGELRRIAHGEGRRLHLADSLVAAAATAVGATIVTRSSASLAATGARLLTYG